MPEPREDLPVGKINFNNINNAPLLRAYSMDDKSNLSSEKAIKLDENEEITKRLDNLEKKVDNIISKLELIFGKSVLIKGRFVDLQIPLNEAMR